MTSTFYERSSASSTLKSTSAFSIRSSTSSTLKRTSSFSELHRTTSSLSRSFNPSRSLLTSPSMSRFFNDPRQIVYVRIQTSTIFKSSWRSSTFRSKLRRSPNRVVNVLFDRLSIGSLTNYVIAKKTFTIYVIDTIVGIDIVCAINDSLNDRTSPASGYFV